ncbi:MAG: hypothetical protein ACPGN3_13600 [Opitutales bacterium]
MKKTITSVLAGASVLAATANAEIVLTDDLSLAGYVDTWFYSEDDMSDWTGEVAEVELGFNFTPEDSAWSAVAEVSYYMGADTYDFETVTITYAASDELSFSVGNILSYQGFETFDATGLYQFSYQGYQGAVAYSAGYAVGASADYVTDDYALGLWVGEADNEASIEVLVAYTGVEDLTVKFIYANDPGYETWNIWGSYVVDAFTFAVEYTDNDFDGAGDVTHLMGLVNYAFGDAGVTFRVTDGDIFGFDYIRYTISPSYTFSDNVIGLVEWSYDDADDEAFSDTQLAAELLFTF